MEKDFSKAISNNEKKKKKETRVSIAQFEIHPFLSKSN